MQALLLVTLILAAAYLFTRPVFSTHWPWFGFRYLFLSGTEFLLVGYLLGTDGLNLIPGAVLEALDPLIHLALGWAGLIFGLQFNRKVLRVYPARRYLLSFVQALAAGGVAALGGWLIVRALFPGADPEAALRAAAIMGIAAAPTAPSSIYYFHRVFRIKGRVNRLLKFVAGVDMIPPVLALGLFACLSHVSIAGFAGVLPGWQWLVVATSVGVLLGLLLFAMVELEFSRDELLLFVLGMVILAAGVARYLHLPAVYISFVMGVTVANTAWNREEVHKVAAYAEKPLYLTFLVLAGTLMVLDDRRVLLLAGALVVLRLAGKVLGNLPWRWAWFEPRATSPLLGLALLSQGAAAIVLALDFQYVYRGDLARAETLQLAVSAVLAAVLVNEVLSPVFIRAVVPSEDPGGEGER